MTVRRLSSGLSERLVAAVKRHHGFTLHERQVQCGRVLTGNVVAEMATGEGKTAAALLPLIHHALSGRTVFVATANDYLARRDAGFAEPVLQEFGCSAGSLQATMDAQDRRAAYRANVTYGTMREFIFDFLRDRNRQAESGGEAVQPATDVLVIDEADSILLDEAVTPCVISGPSQRLPGDYEACLQWTARLAPRLVEGEDYVHLPHVGVALTPAGRSRVARQPMPERLRELTLNDIFHCLELSVRAADHFRRDVHYVVESGNVMIVDDFTGRIGAGRKWSGGIHQAIEAKEGVAISVPTESSASMTIQEYVRRFVDISGMTGTASEAAQEFRSEYGLRVARIPRQLPLRRRHLRDTVCRTREEKWERVIREVQQLQAGGRAVLIGTRTVHASEELSMRLDGSRIEHVVLNARNPEVESGIVAEAGQPGRVTVATNMAGRGTDIRLHEAVRQCGGLHVIGTELHASARIDRQLAGRCGRQGDPGSFHQYMSLEDDLLENACGAAAIEMRKRFLRLRSPRSILRGAQRRLERAGYEARRQLCRRGGERSRILVSLGLDPILTPFPEDDR